MTIHFPGCNLSKETVVQVNSALKSSLENRSHALANAVGLKSLVAMVTWGWKGLRSGLIALPNCEVR